MGAPPSPSHQCVSEATITLSWATQPATQSQLALILAQKWCARSWYAETNTSPAQTDDSECLPCLLGSNAPVTWSALQNEQQVMGIHEIMRNASAAPKKPCRAKEPDGSSRALCAPKYFLGPLPILLSLLGPCSPCGPLWAYSCPEPLQGIGARVFAALDRRACAPSLNPLPPKAYRGSAYHGLWDSWSVELVCFGAGLNHLLRLGLEPSCAIAARFWLRGP